MAAGRLVVPGWSPAVDADGTPIPNAQMFFYLNRTTTLATVYADEALTTPLANPILANSAGQWAAVWADDANLFSVAIDAPYGPPGVPFTFDDLGPSTSANAGALNKLDRDGGNAEPQFLDEVGALSQDGANVAAVFSTAGDFEVTSLGPTVPPPGMYVSRGNAGLSFQTWLSSPSGTPDIDNQRAMVLFNGETVDDGNSEEQLVCIQYVMQTGYRRIWAQSTAYAVGDNIAFGGARNTVYRCIEAGISSATGDGPEGEGLNILDGTVRWMWINDAAINAKLPLYIEAVARGPGGGFAGAGSVWANATNIEFEEGYIGPFAVNTELDLTNNCGTDSVLGGFDKIGLWVAAQGASRSTAGMQVSSANTANDALIWGSYFAGSRLASNSVIGVDASSAIGIGFGAGSGGAVTPNFTIATIRDSSISPDFLVIDGEHSGSGVTVLCDTNASFADSGEKTLTSFFSGATAPSALRAGGSYINAIRISGECSNAQILGTGFAVDPTGRTYATGFQTGISPPASSTAPGVLGQIEFDDSYGYFCVAPNSWKRWALSAF